MKNNIVKRTLSGMTAVLCVAGNAAATAPVFGGFFGANPVVASAADDGEQTGIVYRRASFNEETGTAEFENAVSDENYTVVNGTATAWTDGVYVVTEDVTISDAVTVSGNVSLILCDGATLNANKGIRVADNGSLSIYAQEDNAGKLIAKGENIDYDPNIPAKAAISGNVAIYGGVIEAVGGTTSTAYGNSKWKQGNSGQIGGSAIEGDIAIYGGNITATGGVGGNGGTASSTIGNGGRGGKGGAALSGNINIYGGTFTLAGGAGGKGGSANNPGAEGGIGTEISGTDVIVYNGMFNFEVDKALVPNGYSVARFGNRYGVFKMLHEEAKEPTCTENGNIEYWFSMLDLKYYSDEDATQEISLDDVILPLLTHDLGEPEWDWSDDYTSAAVYVSCNRCGEEFYEPTRNITVERIEPTYDEEGKITYTATAVVDLKTFTDTKTVILDKLERVVHFDAVAPTCTTAGNVEYWIDREHNKIYLDEDLTQEATSLLDLANLAIPSLGHELGEPEWTWADDNSSAHVTVTCTRCGEKVVDADAKITVKRVEPTTEKFGTVTYIASVFKDGENYIDSKVEVLDKLKVATLPEVSFEKGDNSVKLTWTAVDNAEKYAICGFVNNTWKILDQGYKNYYVLNGLKTGTNYKVAVIPMFDGEWKMDFSKAITVTPNASKVPAVSFEKGDNSVKLTWNKVEGAEKYAICGYTDGKWKMLGEGFSTSYVLNGLKTGTNYKVAVIVKQNGKWVSDYSNAITVTPNGTKVPKISFEQGNNSVKLKWTAVEGAEKYAVAGYVKGKWTELAEGTKNYYVLDNLKAGTEYKVAVIAKINGKWNNDFSNAIVVTPKETNVPAYPVVKSQVYQDQFRLQWTAVKGAEKYALAVKVDGNWVTKTQFDANVTTYTSPAMAKGNYTLAIVAKVNGNWELADVDKRAITVSIS